MPAGTASTVEHDQMAPAPQPASLGEDATSVPTPRIAAVLHAAQVDDHFVDVIPGLADQSHAPDRLILLDATAAGDLEQALSRNPGLVDSLPATTVQRVIPGGWSRSALVEAALSLPPDVAAVWFLTGRTAPAPEALRHLRATLLGSPTTGLVGPKLVEWNRPNRLQRFGIQATRAGRLRISPRPGQPDQQQFDDVTDALAVPLDGLLARREVFGELGGPSLRLTEVASDLDLGWRAHLAGHRVVLAPKALVRVADRPEYPPTGATRRDARRVALARGGPFVAPVLAVWMVVTSLLLGLGFLVLKRPARAGRELADIGAVLDPWRPIAARWRARRTTRARRGDLRGLFVGGGATFRHGVDRLHEVIVPSTAPRSLEDLSSGDPLGIAPERGGLLRHPGLWAVAATTAVAVIAGRTLPSGLLGGHTHGFRGGELTGIRADAVTLWSSWWDGWHGPGLGTGSAGSAGMALLAALSWIRGHIPFVDAGPNPAGSALGIAVAAALPLAAASAYVSARVVSTRRWARALAALAWATSPVAAAALSGGRLAALAALVLMPLLGAGLIHLTAPRSRFAVVPATALVAAALAAVLPGTLVLVGLAGVAALIAGTSRVRGRAAGLIALTATAAAPTVLACWERPVRLLTGWGLLDTVGADDSPWRVALLAPPASGDWRAYAAAPLVLVGALGLIRGGRRPALAWGLAATALAGLAITLALPRVAVAVSAEGVDRTGWAGTGQLVMGLGLIGAALAGLEGLDLRALARRRGGLAAWPAVIVGTGASLGLAGLCAWTGFGTALRPALDPRPAVAIDQATGPAASRSLLITSSENGIAYAVRGREPGLPARDLADQGSSTLLDGVVDDLLADAPRPGADPAARLGDWAIGFVVVNAPVAGAVSRHLDSMSGLSRIGDTATAEVWRVDPGVDVGALGSPSRARLLTGGSAATVPVTGSHGATRTAVTAPETALLLLAEPRGWADHGIVTADGKALPLVIRADGRVAAQVPAGTTSLAIEVRPRHPVLAWTYLVLLALLAYLALPLGAPPRPAPQRPEPEPGAGTGRGPGQTSGGRTGSPSGEWTGAEHREGSATVSGEETGSVSGEAAEALSGEGTGVEHREGSGTAPGEGTTTAPGEGTGTAPDEPVPGGPA